MTSRRLLLPLLTLSSLLGLFSLSLSSSSSFLVYPSVSSSSNESHVLVPTTSPPEAILTDSPTPDNSAANSTTTQRRGFLFIKTPKVGGTTLAVTLQRTALAWNMSVAIPALRMDRETCGRSHDDALRTWHRMLKRNPEGLQIFASQVCMHPFMTREGWRGQKPVVIGLVRDAWSRWLSAWRYLEKRCAENDPEMPPDIVSLCTTRLPKGFERYSLDLCGQGGPSALCSVQHAWLAFERSATPAAVLKQYDMILVIEEFDLSLVILHFDYGVPLHALPYLVANADRSAPMPKISPEAKQRVLARGLSLDAHLHRLALNALHTRAAELNTTTQGQFQVVLDRLVRAKQKAKELCSGNDAYDPGDCIVTNKLVKKAESCRHKCLDGIWESEAER